MHRTGMLRLVSCSRWLALVACLFILPFSTHAAERVSALQAIPSDLGTPPYFFVDTDWNATPVCYVCEPAQVAPAGEAGMRIYRDPETGEIGPPNPQFVPPAESSLSQDATGLKAVTLPDGSVMVDLQGRFQEAMIIQLDANGHPVKNCVSDPEAALKQAPVAAPSQTPQREEK